MYSTLFLLAEDMRFFCGFWVWDSANESVYKNTVNDGKSRNLSGNKLWVFLSNNQEAKNAFQSQRSASQCKPVRPIRAPEKHGCVKNINEDLISKNATSWLSGYGFNSDAMNIEHAIAAWDIRTRYYKNHWEQALPNNQQYNDSRQVVGSVTL